MSALNLSRALVLETPVITPDGAGGHSTTWTALGTLWADIRAGSGRERRGTLGPSGDVALRVTLRAAPQGSDSRPRAGQRFREGTRLFRILTVTESDAQGRYLVCAAIEEEAA
jgi:head-tail adaptor